MQPSDNEARISNSVYDPSISYNTTLYCRYTMLHISKIAELLQVKLVNSNANFRDYSMDSGSQAADTKHNQQ